MTKEPLSDKEFREFANSLPKPLLEYLEKNLSKSNAELYSYMRGYFQGMRYIIEMIQPYLNRMEEILNR
jgi:hypothetical protein